MNECITTYKPPWVFRTTELDAMGYTSNRVQTEHYSEVYGNKELVQPRRKAADSVRCRGNTTGKRSQCIVAKWATTYSLIALQRKHDNPSMHTLQGQRTKHDDFEMGAVSAVEAVLASMITGQRGDS